jgi:hypothetical protein
MTTKISARVARDKLTGIDSGDLFRVVRVDGAGKVELEQLPPERPAHVVVGQRPEDWSETTEERSQRDLDGLADRIAALLRCDPEAVGIRRSPPAIILTEAQANALLREVG